MLTTGIVLLAVGVGSLVTSTLLEWKMRQPIYLLAMKVATCVFAAGGAIFCIALAEL